MLDTPCTGVVWRVLATHSIRQFPLHFPSRASPCAITFQPESHNTTNTSPLAAGHTHSTAVSLPSIYIANDCFPTYQQIEFMKMRTLIRDFKQSVQEKVVVSTKMNVTIPIYSPFSENHKENVEKGRRLGTFTTFVGPRWGEGGEDRKPLLVLLLQEEKRMHYGWRLQ